MVIKKTILAMLVFTLSICLFFTLGFEEEIEYENEFTQSQIDIVKADAAAKLAEIVNKLGEFRDMLVAAKDAVDPSDLSSISALEDAIDDCNSLIALLNAKIADFEAGNFVAVGIEEEIEVEWEEDGVKKEAEVEVELEVENEDGAGKVEMEYEGEMEEDADEDEDLDEGEDPDEDEEDDDEDDEDDEDDDDEEDD